MEPKLTSPLPDAVDVNLTPSSIDAPVTPVAPFVTVPVVMDTPRPNSPRPWISPRLVTVAPALASTRTPMPPAIRPLTPLVTLPADPLIDTPSNTTIAPNP